jgi:hypothetical protein
VLLSVGLPEEPGLAVLHASPRFDPHPGESRADALARAHGHFQAFLRRLEAILRERPYLWFNFVPLNAPASAPATDSRAAAGAEAGIVPPRRNGVPAPPRP